LADNQEARGTSLPSLLAIVRRRLGLILLCALLVPASALAFSLIREKEYSAAASLLFRDPGFDQKLFGSTFLGGSEDAARE
jgi:uncharacterized protein involved in exopolysaccharide biosynthesis